MSEDRDRLVGKDDEIENDDVEAHKLAMKNDDEDSNDDDVEAHRLA
jgi:hypothetical protein